MLDHQKRENSKVEQSQRALPWIDWLLPPQLRTSPPDELRRTRMVAGFSFAFFLSALLCVFMAPYVGASVPVSVLVVATLLHGGNLLLLWLVRSRRLASVLFVSIALYVTGHVTYLWGGLFSPGLHWHIVMPLLALFLLGRRWGIAFFFLSLFQATVFFLLHHYQIPLPVADAQEQATGYFVSVCNLFMAAFFAVWLYDSARHSMLKALKDSIENNRSISAERDRERLANEAKSAFLAHMSHELRTPLNAIIGYAELVQEELPGFQADELSSELDSITNAGRDLLAMIQDILDISQLDAGQMELLSSTFALDALLREVLLQAAPRIEQRGNVLEHDFADALGELETDRSRLQQCLEHLLNNTAKFTKNGVVTLRVRRVKAADASELEHKADQTVMSWMEFQVDDTGIGMTQATIDGLFRKFTQGDSSTTKKYGGAGLGLVICRGLARLMGGDLTLDSQPGSGTTATLRIPTTMPST